MPQVWVGESNSYSKPGVSEVRSSAHGEGADMMESVLVVAVAFWLFAAGVIIGRWLQK